MRGAIVLVVCLVGQAHADDPVALVARIRNGTYIQKLGAVKAFGRLGPEGAPAVPELAKLLAAGNEDSEHAARALGCIGAAAVPALKDALRDKSGDVRRLAAAALGDIGPAAAPAVKELAARLKDPDAKVRCEAAKALGDIGPKAAPAVDALLALRKDPDRQTLDAAAWALGAIGADLDRIVPVLLNTIRQGPLEGGYMGARGGLQALGPRAVPYILERLPKAKGHTFWEALVGLLGGHESALPTLMELLVRPSKEPAAGPDYAVVQALAKFRETAALRVAPLLEKDTHRKIAALEVLAALDDAARPAREGILEAAEDKDPEVRLRTVRCLANLGVREPLLKLLETDPDSRVVAEACVVVPHVAKDERVARALARAAKDPAVLEKALLGMLMVGLKTKEVVDAVIEGMKNSDARVTAMLAAGGLKLEQAVAPLREYLKDDDNVTRVNAAEALGEIGPPARSALPALKALLKDARGDWSRREIEKAIAAIETS